MNDWIDLPIISALDYFQGILTFFLTIARKYGTFMGLIGLVWTSFKLINSRIDLKTAWWDTFYKWLIFIFLINTYLLGTTAISKIANELGIAAGNGKSTIINNFTSLKSRIETDLNLQAQWANGLADLVNKETGVQLDYIEPGQSVEDYLVEIGNSDKFNGYKFSSKQQKKQIQEKIKDYIDTYSPENENSVWSEQTLQALNSVLIVKNADGSPKGNLTDAYVTDKPELNIWLKDSEGKPTCYLSASAIGRIGVLTAQIIWEKSQMVIHDEGSDDGEKKSWGEKITGVSWDHVCKSVMAGIMCIGLIASIIFAIIQYVMCILEYIIVQGIGAGFIPLYLFDGTKEIPKKLVPVFTGFIIKIIVMVICLMFVINLYLNYAAEQISPSSGSMGWATFFEGLFIILLSFILTSNAPKIAMTLLTGQPQLSMGEFVQAAGAMAGIGAAGANLAKTSVSPAAALAKEKAHEWGERRGAASEAEGKQENNMKSQFAKDHGIDTSTREGQNNLNKKWDIYRNSEDHKEEIDNKLATAGANAANEVKAEQKANYLKHGGIAGSAGRMLAHYSGALLNPKQTLMQGRNYNIPMDSIDINRIANTNSSLDWIPSYSNDNSEESEHIDEQIKEENAKNELPKDPAIGERQYE